RMTELPLGAFDPTWLPDGSGLVVAGALIKGHLTIEATTREIERREHDPVKAHVTEDRVYRFWDRWLTTGEVPHLFLVDAKTGAIRDLPPDSPLWFDFMDPSGQYDLSPDGREIALSGLSPSDATGYIRSAIWTVSVAGGAMTCLTPDHPADDHQPRYRPDGKTIVYGMQLDPNFYADRVRLMEFDRATRKHAEIAPTWELSPTHWTFASDGGLYLETEENARTSLFALRGAGAPKRIVDGGTVAAIHPAANGRVFFTLQSQVAPPEVFACAADGANLTRVTHLTDEIAAGYGTGEVREMTLDGAYGETIQMYVVLPPGCEAGKKYPMLMLVHGGPHAISG